MTTQRPNHKAPSASSSGSKSPMDSTAVPELDLQPRTTSFGDRCSFTSPAGYRCRRLCAPYHASLCTRHVLYKRKGAPAYPEGSLGDTASDPFALEESAGLPRTPGTAQADLDVTADLLSPTEDFRTAAAINHTLGKLLILLAGNRIAPRRASTIAYVCQLLLQSLSGVKEETSQVTNCNEVYDKVRRVLDATSPLREPAAPAS